MSEGVEAATIGAQKSTLRDSLRAQRHTFVASHADALHDSALELAERLAWWTMVRGAGTVTAYASRGDEPNTDALLDAIKAQSVRVLLPVVTSPTQLQWSPYLSSSDLELSERGIREPNGPRYESNVLSGVDLMIVPALAITTDGVRLGQGGGHYDRVLSLVRPDVPIIAMIYDHELLPAGAIPHEAHDVRVTHVCTPNDGLRAVKPASATP